MVRLQRMVIVRHRLGVSLLNQFLVKIFHNHIKIIAQSAVQAGVP